MANLQQANIPNLNAAIDGMATEGNNIAQSLRSFTIHQQAFGTELSLLGNTPLGQIQLQLNTMQATMQTGLDLADAR